MSVTASPVLAGSLLLDGVPAEGRQAMLERAAILTTPNVLFPRAAELERQTA